MKRCLILFISIFLLSLQAVCDPPAGYYNSAEGLTGSSLKSALQQIISSGHNPLGYNEAKDLMWGMIDNHNGYVRCRYIGEERLTSTPDTLNTNTEHTWPQSRGADVLPKRSDIHHLFIVDVVWNSKRGNLPFGYVTNPDDEEGGSKVDYDSRFEPRNDHKGDCARAVLYMDVRYTDFSLVNSGQALGDKQMGYLDDLLEWHTLDPVSEEERDRNDAIYSAQGNRNPFVDHPEYVQAVYIPQPTATPTATNTPSPTPTATSTPTPPPPGTLFWVY